MADSGGLTRRQARFIAALFECASVGDAARLAGISERSASRYLADSGVRAELLERQSGMLAAASARLVAGMPASADVLIAIQSDSTVAPAVRVSAARAVLGAGLRLAELYTLAERVSELETRFVFLGGVTDTDF